MEFDDLKRCVEKTIEEIYTSEAYLIKHSLSEWTLSAQFHYYMRNACLKFLKGYDFDSEYNLMRHINDKGLAQKYICVNGQRLRVRPDFIIHKRGESTNNYLWVELKRRGGEGWENDLKRVMAVTQERVKTEGVDYVTGYTYGLGVLFHKRDVKCEWYAGGRWMANARMSINSAGAWNCVANEFAEA